MSNLVACRGFSPIYGENTFLAPSATLIGEVILGDFCSVWFNAVIRGDVNSIHIGHYTNIQDGVIIHGTYEKHGTSVGDYVSVGHNALIHGCTLTHHILIGMGAIVMDGAIIEPYCMIAAGAVVLQGFCCETGYLYAGVPAKKVKPLTTQQQSDLDILPLNYVRYASWFQNV